MNKVFAWQIFLSAACFTLSSSVLISLPQGMEVVAGMAEIAGTEAKALRVRTSDKAILEYESFGIGRDEKVVFMQPSSSSTLLSRVKGASTSKILGSLESNGNVFLVNPQGIYFGPEAQVNVGSLVASTLDIANADFLEGNYHFFLKEGSQGQIRNEGLLKAEGGVIALLSPRILNTGVIEANAGTVLLASGEHVTLDFTGDELVQFSIEGSLKEALVEHLGQIRGKKVFLQTQAAHKAVADLVNLEGAEEGQVFIEVAGKVRLAKGSEIAARSVEVQSSFIEALGSIDASNLEGKGGNVHLFGREILLTGASIDASGNLGGGEVLIGGEFQGGGKTPYASQVSMDARSSLFADALEQGEGGLVVLWSLDRTLSKGQIFARGIERGGLVETSSKGLLDIGEVRVNTLASSGLAGDWLLDPISLFIGFSGTDCSGFGGCSGNTLCNIPTSAFLGVSTNVTVQAQETINVESSFSLTGTGGFVPTLTFSLCQTQPFQYALNLGTGSSPITITTDGGSITCPESTVLYQDATLSSFGGSIVVPNLYSLNNSYSLDLEPGSGSVQVSTGPYQEGTNVLNLTVSNASSVTTSNLEICGNLMLTSAPLIVEGSSVSVATTVAGGNGNMTVPSIQQSSAASPTSLTLSAGTGAVSLGSVGSSSSPLADVSIDAGSLSLLSSVYASGDIQIGPVANLTGTSPVFQTTSGKIEFEKAVALAGSGTVTFQSSSGKILFDSTLAGPQSLEIAAGSGSVVFSGDVGLSPLASLVSLNVSSGSGGVFLGNVETSGGKISIAPSANILGTNVQILSHGGPVTFSGSVSLGGSGSVTIDSLGGDILFGSSLYGPQDLILRPGSGTVEIDGFVGFSPLSSFKIEGGSLASFSNITTTGQVQVASPISLIGSSQILSSSGGIVFQSSVEGAFDLTLKAGSGPVWVGGEIDGLGSFSVLTGSSVSIKDVTTYNGIEIVPPLQLSEAMTYLTTLSNGDISLGSVDAASIGAVQSLTLSAGLGAVLLGPVGMSAYITDLTISSAARATVEDILTSGPISLLLPVTLASPSTLSTQGGGNSGASISLAEIDGTSSGEQSLVLSAGTGEILLTQNIGEKTPLGDLLMSGSEISFEGSLISTAGTQTYESPFFLSKNSTLRSLGAIQFASSVEPSFGAPSLSLYLGGGALAFPASLGNVPLGMISVFNSSSFSAGDISAQGLLVSGGRSQISLLGEVDLSGREGIYLNGGTIELGGEIFAKSLFFRSEQKISNLSSPAPISISTPYAFSFVSFNSLQDTVGEESSPIEINTSCPMTVGARPSAFFIGSPAPSKIALNPSNPPCLILLNGAEIYNCRLLRSLSEIFASVPKKDWYVPGLYSSWDNLSNDEYFQVAPVSLSRYAKEAKLVYQKLILYRDLPWEEEAVRSMRGTTPRSEEVEWDVEVRFPKEPEELGLF